MRCMSKQLPRWSFIFSNSRSLEFFSARGEGILGAGGSKHVRSNSKLVAFWVWWRHIPPYSSHSSSILRVQWLDLHSGGQPQLNDVALLARASAHLLACWNQERSQPVIWGPCYDRHFCVLGFGRWKTADDFSACFKSTCQNNYNYSLYNYLKYSSKSDILKSLNCHPLHRATTCHASQLL